MRKKSPWSQKIRRAYNTIAHLLDRQAFHKQIKVTCPNNLRLIEITAKQAFEQSLALAKKYDRGACLTMIVSLNYLNDSGESDHWEVFFDLPKRRAKLICEWVVTLDDETQTYVAPGFIEGAINPFPSENSFQRKMVQNGEILYHHLIWMWKQEHKQTPKLPQKFRDTHEVYTEFARQGLDDTIEEVTLSTEVFVGNEIYWVGRGRDSVYQTKFSAP